MNGFEIFAESYKKALAENPDAEDKELLKKKVRAFSFLAECDAEDICVLYDTGAFNDATKGFARQAMINCGLSDKVSDVIQEIDRLHDETSAAVISQS